MLLTPAFHYKYLLSLVSPHHAPKTPIMVCLYSKVETRLLGEDRETVVLKFEFQIFIIICKCHEYSGHHRKDQERGGH